MWDRNLSHFIARGVWCVSFLGANSFRFSFFMRNFFWSLHVASDMNTCVTTTKTKQKSFACAHHLSRIMYIAEYTDIFHREDAARCDNQHESDTVKAYWRNFSRDHQRNAFYVVYIFNFASFRFFPFLNSVSFGICLLLLPFFFFSTCIRFSFDSSVNMQITMQSMHIVCASSKNFTLTLKNNFKNKN